MTEQSALAATGKLVPDLVLTRVLDAPRGLVFKVWTDPQHVQQWWGPHGFTNPVCDMDVRPGGALRITMRGPDGALYPGGGTFHEIIEPERIVFTTTAFEDKSGVPQLEVLNTVTFVEQGGRTTLTLTAVVLKSTPELADALAGMEAGWSQSLEKFTAEVAGAAGGSL